MNVIADELKLQSDAPALLLIGKIKELSLDYTNIYYNFPFYRGETKSDLVSAHLLLVSKEYGVIFFRCFSELNQYNEFEKAKLDELDGYIFSKINKREELRVGRRELKINATPYVFVSSAFNSNDQTIIGISKVREVIIENKLQELSDDDFDILIAIIEGTANLKQKKERELPKDIRLTKGKILSTIQAKEAVFDLEQKKAALNIIDSPQRIRGLAGSGKTIILTMKAALFHLQNPESEILYTYFTKSLFGQVKYLIEKFYRDFSENREPDWSKINILHGWGGRGLRGVYSDTCFINNIIPIDFYTAKKNNPKDPFSYIFEQLEKEELEERYDLTLIDEGQDFPRFFYRVCRRITKNSRIVWAYDDFQNIFDVDIQNEKETFGKDSEGNYYVDFSINHNRLQDIILYKCYRNPRFVLTAAFALGLGIYNEKVLQRLENNKHWEDLGFQIEAGNSINGDNMRVIRPESNSPIETNKYFNEDSINISVFEDFDSEIKFIVERIENDIRNEYLKPDDICVICLDARNIGTYFSKIESKLLSKNIRSFNLLDAPNNNTYFSIKNYVTLSTINKAKGNEMGMVYIIGVDAVFNNKNYIIYRNQLFTAITRSKGWVHITGMSAAILCKNEIDSLKSNDYKLIFTQPSTSDTKTIFMGIDKQQSFLNDVSRRLEEFSKQSGMSVEDILKTIELQNKVKE